MPNEKCNGKEPYFTRAEAEAACALLKEDARRTGKGGRSFKRLNVYACATHFHIGRRNSYAKLKPLVKRIPSRGDLLRRLRHVDEMMDKQRRHRAYVYGQLIQKQAEEEAAHDRQALKNLLSIIYAPLRPEDV